MSGPDALQEVGKALLAQLKEAQSVRGEKITLADVEAILGGVIDSLSSGQDAFEQRVQHEIRDILSHLTATRQELATMGNPGINRDKLADANSSLDDAIKATEEAANAILDAADQLAALAATLPAAVSEEAMAHINTIYESCNFQDLAGQRIRKVMKVIEYIETRLTALSAPDTTEPPVSFEQSLMNGPQAHGQAPNQTDIDALFDQLPPAKKP